ncbi:MAG: hypothetical protein WCT08_04245 [Patescibacteria group bacterium]|jgi:hypothetical protein
MKGWFVQGGYEYEYDKHGQFTGWCRCVGGRMANGSWPQWNNLTGKSRP